jgi:DNA-binding NtrC family response regulator
LRAATWAGNVRELRAYVDQAIATDGAEVTDATVPLIDGDLPLREARQRWLHYFEQQYVGELLARTNNNVSAAAILAGVDRVYMHRMITRAGLRDRLPRNRR